MSYIELKTLPQVKSSLSILIPASRHYGTEYGVVITGIWTKDPQILKDLISQIRSFPKRGADRRSLKERLILNLKQRRGCSFTLSKAETPAAAASKNRWFSPRKSAEKPNDREELW